MKKVILGGLAAGAVALGIAAAVPAPAHVDKKDDDFTQVLEQGFGIHISSPVTVAHAMRKDFAGGNTRDDEIDQLVMDGGLTEQNAAYFVGVAISAYCPQYKATN